MSINFGSNTDTKLYFGADTAPTMYLGETLVYGGSWDWTIDYYTGGFLIYSFNLTEMGLPSWEQVGDTNYDILFRVSDLAEDGSSFTLYSAVGVNNRSYGSSTTINLGAWEEKKTHQARVNGVDYYAKDVYVTYEEKGKIVIVDVTEHVDVPVSLHKTTGTGYLSAGTYPYENLDTGTITTGAFEGQELALAYLNPEANLEGEYDMFLAGYFQVGVLKGAFTLTGDGQNPLCKLLYKTGHSMPARVLPADTPVPSTGPLTINPEDHTLTLEAGTYQYFDWATYSLKDITIEKTDNIADPAANMVYRNRNIYNTLIQIKDYQGTWLTACDKAEEMSSLSVANNFVYGGNGTPALQYKAPTGIRFNTTFDVPTDTLYTAPQHMTVNSSLFNLTSSSRTNANITLKCYDEDDNLLYTKHGGTTTSEWDYTKAILVVDNNEFNLQFTQGVAVKRFEFEWINMSGIAPSSNSQYYVLEESSFIDYIAYTAGVFPVYFDYNSWSGEPTVYLTPQPMMEGVTMVGKLVYNETSSYAIQALPPD